MKPNTPLWKTIDEAKPQVGDIIACCDEHRDGGLMFWAGTVTEVEDEFIRMETRGDITGRFIVTCNTFWTPLPAPIPIDPPKDLT